MVLENPVEVQCKWSSGYRTEPSTRLTITHIREKFEIQGTICDVHKGRSGRPRTSTNDTVTGQVCLKTLRVSVLPAIHTLYGNEEFYFQQDGAPPRYHRDIRA